MAPELKILPIQVPSSGSFAPFFHEVRVWGLGEAERERLNAWSIEDDAGGGERSPMPAFDGQAGWATSSRSCIHSRQGRAALW